jgi:hypothetical protein
MLAATSTDWGKIVRAMFIWVGLSAAIFIFTPRALKLMALLGIIGLWVIYGAVALGNYTRAIKVKRGKVVIGADGEVLPSSDITPEKPLHLRGRGTSASRAYTLPAGVYRIGFRFPTESPVCVEVINVTTSAAQPLLDRAGVGSIAYTVEAGGRYVFQVTPTDAESDWGIDVQPLE